MDGKHIVIRPPTGSGSYYFNLDVGCNGRISDSGVFKNCSLFNAMENNTLQIPPPEPLDDGSRLPIPYMMVADDAFPLKQYIQKPFGQAGLTNERRIFNYRLSRARRIIENSFGILANRFRIYMAPINLSPHKVEKIIIACCSLHNFLCTKNTSTGVIECVVESSLSKRPGLV